MTKEANTLKWTALSRWGMLFRTLFIPFLGIAGYLWIDPQPIGDIPFAQLTLNQVFKSLFAFLIAAGCLLWFFKFPDKGKFVEEDPSSNPYYIWGALSIFIAFAVIIVTMIALFSAPLLGVLQEMFGAISEGW